MLAFDLESLSVTLRLASSRAGKAVTNAVQLPNEQLPIEPLPNVQLPNEQLRIEPSRNVQLPNEQLRIEPSRC